MGWCFGGSVGTEQFWWRILDKNNIHSFHLCMISGNQDEAWPMYHVWPISERYMLGLFSGNSPACCPWMTTGTVGGGGGGGGCPIMFVLTQSYQCDTWFFSSTLRELAVSNLGQLLLCQSITWTRCRNGYRILWIMTIDVFYKRLSLMHDLTQLVCACVIWGLYHQCFYHRNYSSRNSITRYYIITTLFTWQNLKTST